MEDHQSPRAIRVATAADVKWLDYLQHVHTETVGFLVKQALITYADRGNVLISAENDQPAGYILHRPALRWRPEMATIVQAAVEMDALRAHHGLQLLARIEAAARARGQVAIQANCAVGVPANAFWKAAGFIPVVHMTPRNRRGREIICWRKPLTRKIPLWFILPPPRTGITNTATLTHRNPRRSDVDRTMALEFICRPPKTKTQAQDAAPEERTPPPEGME